MVTPLFKQGLRNIAPLFGAVVAVLLVYIGTVVYLYDPSVSESLALMQEAMPELFAAFGMANPSATLLDFLLNYLYGFLLTATFVLLGAFMAQRYVVGPAKDGSLAWTLATPHSRTSLALTLVVVEAVARHLPGVFAGGPGGNGGRRPCVANRPLALCAVRRLRVGVG